MKKKKKAAQQNLMLDTDYYTREEIKRLKDLGIVCDLKEMYKGTFEEETLVIFTEELKEIKVILDDYGMYKTVAVNFDNEKFFIKL